MFDAVCMAIDELRDPAAKPRLVRCLPMLMEAMSNYPGPAVDDFGLTIAAATPHSAVVLACTAGWLIPNAEEAAKLDHGAVATAVARAVESAPTKGTTDTIAMGLSVLLGTAGIAAQISDATEIVKSGGHPLVVALLEEQLGTVTLIVTTVAIGARGLLH